MIPSTLAPIVLSCIVGISIVLMLVRPKGIPEVYWVGSGALLLVILRLVPLKLAGKAIARRFGRLPLPDGNDAAL